MQRARRRAHKIAAVKMKLQVRREGCGMCLIQYIEVLAASFPLFNSKYYFAKSFVQSPLLRKRGLIFTGYIVYKRKSSLFLWPSIKYLSDILALLNLFAGPLNFISRAERTAVVNIFD